jgi:hypothetical protein
MISGNDRSEGFRGHKDDRRLQNSSCRLAASGLEMGTVEDSLRNTGFWKHLRKLTGHIFQRDFEKI